MISADLDLADGSLRPSEVVSSAVTLRFLSLESVCHCVVSIPWTTGTLSHELLEGSA